MMLTIFVVYSQNIMALILKKIRMKTLGILFLTAFILLSCNSDDVPDQLLTRAVVALETAQLSQFDVNTDLEISIETINGFTVDQINVLRNNEIVANAIISGNSATFNSSSLIPFQSTINLDLEYTVSNGNTFKILQEEVDILDPFFFTQEIPTLSFRDSSAIEYGSFTVGATIDNVGVEWKVGKKGTFVKATRVFDTDSDAFPLSADTYINQFGAKKGDTLFVRLNATSGSVAKEIETSVVLVPQSFGVDLELKIGSIDDINETNLFDPNVFSDGDDTADVVFTDPQGISVNEGTDISFVRVHTAEEPEDFYAAYNDVEVAKSDFDAGTPQTSLQVNVGDIYIYRAIRDLKIDSDIVEKTENYGIILITEITETVEDLEIDFLVKENTIIE
ncbi:hypothetical protein SAMN04488508_105321 [Aquimarina spongiae]|uniref:Uncharacterized protein n=2 Tax=Aquimarina spongiae TaxID=570521 RepID=A0A1M6GJZ7_9FLAO|nr:hypothetical protein SAMN04488508_105321 [Aquimarina spongiae]